MQLYKFNSYCVYGLYARNKLIYVGHTNNIITRIQKHKTRKKFNEYKILHETKNLRLSLYYERKLIRIVQPPLNRTHNPSFCVQTASLYQKKLNKSKLKSKIKYNQKTISKKEFGIFTRIDSQAWKLTKTKIKEDEVYLKQILNSVKKHLHLTLQLMSQKIINDFGERLPSNSNRLNQWVYFTLKILREEKNNIQNINTNILKEKQEENRIIEEKIIEKMLIEQQNERNKKVFDPLDVNELKITKPTILTN